MSGSNGAGLTLRAALASHDWKREQAAQSTADVEHDEREESNGDQCPTEPAAEAGEPGDGEHHVA